MNATFRPFFMSLPGVLLILAWLLAGPFWQARADDHGDSLASASYFPARVEWGAAGVMDSAADVDVFAFSSGAGEAWVRLAPGTGAADVRFRAELMDAEGRVLTGMEVSGVAGDLALNLGNGRYFLAVRAPLGNLPAAYTLTGRVPVPVTGIPPVAVIPLGDLSGVAPVTAALDGSTSFDLDGRIADLRWDFGDGTQGSGAQVSHVYSTPGVYTVVLTVTDNEGLTHTDELVVTVRVPSESSSASPAGTITTTVDDPVGPELDTKPVRRCLRVVESTLPVALAEELAQHERDLKEAGWQVETVFVPRRDLAKPLQHIDLAQREIWPRVRTSTNLHVFLIGKLPMPRSGYASNPDGHADTKGAYACTAYFAMPDAGWTDLLDNSSFATRPALINRPGDGKFDQDTVASLEESLGGEVRAAVGFLDLSFANPRTFGSMLSADDFLIDRYKRYFARLHGYRKGTWAPRTAVAHMAYDGRPWAGIAAWATGFLSAEGYQFFRTYGSSATQPFTVESRAPFGVVVDFKVVSSTGAVWTSRTREWAVLDLYHGSYQVDFGSPRLVNPLLSGAIATGSLTWNSWNLAGLYEGATLGDAWRQSVSGTADNLCRVLYGDPTVELKR